MTELQTQVCANCGIKFAMPLYYTNKRREDGGSFYCPNGHILHFGDSEADKLRKERDRLKQKLELGDARLQSERNRRATAERTATAYKGHHTRLKNRLQAENHND